VNPVCNEPPISDTRYSPISLRIGLPLHSDVGCSLRGRMTTYSVIGSPHRHRCCPKSSAYRHIFNCETAWIASCHPFCIHCNAGQHVTSIRPIHLRRLIFINVLPTWDNSFIQYCRMTVEKIS